MKDDIDILIKFDPEALAVLEECNIRMAELLKRLRMIAPTPAEQFESAVREAKYIATGNSVPLGVEE